MNRRVVITGLGAISAGGTTISDIWQKALAGADLRSEISPHHFDVHRFDEGVFPRRKKTSSAVMVCGSKLTNHEMAEMLSVRADRFSREQLFALWAAQDTLIDSNLLQSGFNPDRFGCVMGIGGAGLSESFQAAETISNGGRLRSDANLRFLPLGILCNAVRRFSLRGPGDVSGTGCAASANAICQGVRLILLDEADIVLCGGAEAPITALGISSFCVQGVLGNGISYSADRDGFVMGEGAACLTLEEYHHAIARGAKIYAEIIGYGVTNDGDASVSFTRPSGEGGVQATKRALQMAGIMDGEGRYSGGIDYINAHGTGTEIGDLLEIQGIQSWSSDFRPLISSTKAHTGHLLGAAGTYELMLTIKMMGDGVALATQGLTTDTIDPAFHEAHLILTNESLRITQALSLSFGFGGTNVALVLKSL